MKGIGIVFAAIIASAAVAGDLITVEPASNTPFHQHEQALLGVTRAPDAPVAVAWNDWTTGGVENFAVNRGGKLVCLLSFRLGEPMVMDWRFKPSHHRRLVGVLVVSESLAFGTTQLVPGTYGAWLEGTGSSAQSASTTLVLRNTAGQETSMTLAKRVQLLQRNRYAVEMGTGGATLRVNDVALATIGGNV
jgi:hypothetical protein